MPSVGPYADDFIDTEQLPKKPSMRKIWKLRKVRSDLRATNWGSGGPRALALTDEDTRALAWIGDEESLFYLSSYSNDPQTLAIVARKAMEIDLASSVTLRVAVASRSVTTAETLNFLSTNVGFGGSVELLKNPNTPLEALDRILDRVHPALMVETLTTRDDVSTSLAVKVSVKAHMFDVDTTPELKKFLCKKLGKPLGHIVWVEAARQIRLSEFPDIDVLTVWARKRTENWDARTIAALEALQDAEDLDRETLCLAAEELAANKQPAERKGDPREKNAKAGQVQSV